MLAQTFRCNLLQKQVLGPISRQAHFPHFPPFDREYRLRVNFVSIPEYYVKNHFFGN